MSYNCTISKFLIKLPYITGNITKILLWEYEGIFDDISFLSSQVQDENSTHHDVASFKVTSLI